MTRVTTEMSWTGRKWIVRLIADGTPVLDMTLDEFIALQVTQYVLEEAEQASAEAARYAKRTRVDIDFGAFAPVVEAAAAKRAKRAAIDEPVDTGSVAGHPQAAGEAN
jgi:hypothetical protein